jgi:hypothetical protein
MFFISSFSPRMQGDCGLQLPKLRLAFLQMPRGPRLLGVGILSFLHGISGRKLFLFYLVGHHTGEGIWFFQMIQFFFLVFRK